MGKKLKIQTVLKEKFYRLPYLEMEPTAEKIMNACGITHRVWTNWLNGDTAVPKLAREKIAIILGHHEQELFQEGGEG